MAYSTILCIVLLFCSCHEIKKENSNSNLSLASDSTTKYEIHIDLEKILGKLNRKNAQTVQVKYDHYFKSSKKYLGYAFDAMIDSITKLNNFDTTNAVVVFECADGYQPTMDLSKIFGAAKGYIVYKDLDQENNKDWADSIYAKFKPYYLAWDNVPKNDNSFMWPYGLTGLRLVSMQKQYQYVYPFKQASLTRGFYLYRDNCMKCHSMNKVGGTIGPEFNVPKNITEYWQEKDIVEFAKSPNAYRYNSRMPAITNLSNADFEEIMSYMKYMKNKKIK